MRILGIDYGERRVGLALSDPTGLIAGPLATLTRRPGRRPPVGKLAEIVLQNEVEAVVIGLPLGLDGEENAWCREVRVFAQALGARAKVPVYLQDERMSSVMAERGVRESGVGRSKRREKERVDRAAAVVILQRWLDTRHAFRSLEADQ